MTARASASRRPASAPLPWIDKWLAACHDLAELERSNPMTDAVIEEIDGRMIRVGDKWLADFASCNYLGFDLEREIIDVVPSYLAKWGTHPSWSRLLGSPVLYEQIEERLAELRRRPGHARPADDHPDPHVGDPRACRERHDLRRIARAQDDLRRMPTGRRPRRDDQEVHLRRRGGSRALAPRGRRAAAPDLRRRCQQHDGQRDRPAGLREPRP